jgi:hypothetical protein
MEDLYRSQFRLPYSLFDQLKAAADKSGRSVNAEVVSRLTDSFVEERVIGGIVERLADRLARPENKSELEALLEIIFRLTEEGSTRDK